MLFMSLPIFALLSCINLLHSNKPQLQQAMPKGQAWAGAGLHSPASSAPSEQRSLTCGTQPQRAVLCWKGTMQHVMAASGELFSLLVRSYTHLLLSQKPSLVPLWQSAAGYGVLLDTSPEQQKHRAEHSLESAGDRCNMIPGKLISANSKAKKWSYLITPVLGRAWCILPVISIFCFYKLELFAFKH